MALHTEINPNPDTLPLDVATEALRLARRGLTHNVGTVQIPNPNGDDLIFGAGADDGANWVDGEGNQSPLVDTEFFKQGIEQANQEIDGINDRLDQMDAEADQLQEHIDSVRREAQENFETAKATADAAAERADAASREVADFRTEVGETVQTVKDSVSSVRSDVDAVTQKASDLASELDGTKATVEQVVTEQGEIKSSVSNAVEKADQSLKVSTQASQTATAASQKAISAYEDAQTAINQSSEAVQTANEVSLSLKTDYQTKADADAKYATQASLTATSEQIRTEVSETYATQATVNALENLANNAVQTWMGDGVPSLSNKPASDWTTDELKAQHSGDLYYDTNTGYAYRFGSNDGTNYSWALVKDTDITKALADAAKAQETAEGAQSGVNELKTSIPVTYATKSELSQKADSITARVEEVAQAGETTSSKVAELELTADGLQTTVREQASKIDQNATTISQVSQKADNLSSTITQVSGRVDDVEDKADAAQGTANSAMSQASRVEQSLNSFKTSVSRDYQTKTDALSQKSELEQNLNSFKTTVSETYETQKHASDTYLDKNAASSTYTSKTEFKQTTDKISATTTAASQNASSALSKISSLEVSVDGIDAKVEENASDIADAVKTTSQVSQRVDSLTSTITQVQGDIDRIDANSQNFITNPQFKSGNADGVQNTSMEASDSNAGKLPGTATSYGKSTSGYDNWCKNVRIKGIPGHTYRIEIDAKRASDNTDTSYGDGVGLFFWYFTEDNPGLSKNGYTSYNGKLIPASVTDWTHGAYDYVFPSNSHIKVIRPAYRTPPSKHWLVTNFTCTDVTAIAEVQKDADKAVSTANSALSQSSTVKQELTSFKTSVQQTYETKNDALSKQSSLQQSVNNLRTEVSETYTTKTEFENLRVGGTNLVRNSNFSDSRSDWSDWGSPSTREIVTINSKTWAHIVTSKRNFQGYQQRTLASQTIHGGETYTFSCLAYAGDSSSSKFTVGIHANKSNGAIINQSWYTDDTLGSDPKRIVYTFAIPENCEQFNVMVGYSGTDSVQNIYFTDIKLEVGAKPTDWSPAPEDMLSTAEAAQTYSTKSYVDQTARTVSLGVVEEYKDGQHGSALATQSDITATKNSITQTVSQTYLSKTDATNTYLNKNTAASTYATKTEVKQTSDSLTVTISSAMSKAESAATAASNAQNTANAAAGSSTNYIKNGGPNGTSNPIAGWTVSGNVYKHTFPGGQNHVDLGYTTLAHPIVAGRTYRLSLDARVTSGTFSSSDYFVFGLSGGWQDIKAKALTSSWKTYSGVVTSTKEATQVFTSSYVGSSGSKVVEMRNVSMTDVTETYNAAIDAQNTANTANTNATNANNRVGNLETCIKMTSDGVRVGKISNGNFTGYSALVNSAGSFDILDGSGGTVTRFGANQISIPSTNNGNSNARLQLTSAGYDLAFTRNGTTYYLRLGTGGIGIHAPDGSYVDVGSGGIGIHAADGSYADLSSSKGLTLETKKLGVLSIGSGGLRLTNDQGWGFQLSVTGWSIDWSGGHRIATGDEPGALYIDGRKVQVE